MIASVGSGVAQGMAKTAAAEIVMNAIFGNFNPTYNKESRRRMRYIQQKYALAYGPPGAAADAGTIIKDIGL